MNNNQDWQKVFAPLFSSLNIANEIDFSGITNAINETAVKNMPDISQTFKSAIACNEELASSIKSLDLKTSTTLTTGLKEAINGSLINSMPDISQTIKSAIACNEALASSIKGLDFKSSTTLTTGLKEAVNELLISSIPSISQTVKSAIACDEALASYFIEINSNNSIFSSSTNINYDEIIKEEYTEDIIEQLANNVEPEEIANNLEKKTKIKWEVWLPIIFTLIQTLLMIYSTLIQTPQEINNYHIEIHQENSDQITDDVYNDMNNKSNSQN